MKAKVAVVVLFFVTVTAGLGIGSYLYLRNKTVEEVAAFQTELRNGLVESCERNGNPLREAVQKMLREQIARSDPAEIRRFFPQIPPQEIEQIISEQTRANRSTLREIAPVDCVAQYPRR